MKRFMDGIVEAYDSIWTEAQRSSLPNRVLQSIQRNDELSEVLVKVIQFFVFSFLGLVYFASPAPNPETVSQLPLILAFYLVFTVVTLIFAVYRAMPGWLIYLSIFIDITLLTYLIYSFHIQYGQPASFSLKAPEMLNYFVLIGLRALRFESRYVIAAGFASVAGWLLLVAYVVVTDPLDPMITRDYVTYLTSNTVLIGAEIGKIMTLILFTTILAIAVRRAHSFLVASVAEGNAAEDLARFLPDVVAEQIRDSNQRITAGDGVRREAAILNVDIRGFTTLVSKMEPQDAVAILSDYQHNVVPIAHRHEGIVDKFMGDGIMITFGASRSDSKYCANALRCANEILESRAEWTGPAANMPINVAVASGPVIYGAVGDGDRLEYTVIGPAVNDSAKLEKHNKVAKTNGLCDQETFEKAIAQGYVGSIGKKMNRVSIDGGGVFDLVVLG